MNLTLVFAFFVFLASINPHRPSYAAAADIVADTCQMIAAGDREIDQKLCLSLFDSDPRSHGADIRGLALISINFTETAARQVLSDVEKLINQEANNTYKKRCLKDCKESYDDSMSELEDSAESIGLSRIADARTELSASFDASDTCDDCFSEGNIQSPLAEDNRYYADIARIPLAIAALLFLAKTETLASNNLNQAGSELAVTPAAADVNVPLRPPPLHQAAPYDQKPEPMADDGSDEDADVERHDGEHQEVEKPHPQRVDSGAGYTAQNAVASACVRARGEAADEVGEELTGGGGGGDEKEGEEINGEAVAAGPAGEENLRMLAPEKGPVASRCAAVH